MKLPTILCYEKKCVPSSGLMFARTYDGKKIPLEIEPLHGRGAKTDHAAGHGEKDSDLGEWMPLRQDFCQLPHNAENLVIEFPLKYLPCSGTPYSCNDPEWIDLLEELALLYGKVGGYQYQAHCQMAALFQGLPFWRNNDAESMSLFILNISDKTLPPYLFRGFPTQAEALSGTNKSQFDSLVLLINQALSGQRKKLRLRVMATLEKDILEEVYPSQQFIEKLPAAKKEFFHRQGKYQKSREYAFYKLGSIQQAMLHPTKIGAGLRWDHWNKSGIAVPISAYSLDAKKHQALRGRGSKQDFYSLMMNIKNHITTLRAFDGDIFTEESVSILGDIHFIMANIIKGGVFNRESSKKKSNDEASDEVDLSNP